MLAERVSHIIEFSVALVPFIICLTDIPGFSLRGQSYPNHGLVLIDDIGETDNVDRDPDNGLHCVSDLSTCCSAASAFRGEFDFPNGTQVPIDGNMMMNEYFRNRAADRIFLNRRPGGTTQGLFRCQIVTSQTSTISPAELYIGVYSADLGSPRITGLTYDIPSRTLTCTTTGGSATTITWRRDCGVLDTSTNGFVFSQTVTDQSTATYSNTLTLPSPVADGSYSCTVANTRGYDTRMIQVGSEFHINESISYCVDVL